MKKEVFGPAALFAFVLVVFLASFVFSSQVESAASEEAMTLQKIAPYRTWGKANVKPIVVSIDGIASGG